MLNPEEAKKLFNALLNAGAALDGVLEVVGTLNNEKEVTYFKRAIAHSMGYISGDCMVPLLSKFPELENLMPDQET